MSVKYGNVMMGENPKQWHLFWEDYPGRLIITNLKTIIGIRLEVI